MMQSNHNDRPPYGAAWLGDRPGASEDDALQAGLDALFLRGPGMEETEAAMKRLFVRLQREQGEVIYYDILESSPIGSIAYAAKESGVIAINFDQNERAFSKRLVNEFGGVPIRSPEKTAEVRRQLQDYFSGKISRFELPLSLEHLTDFQREVLLATLEVRKGQVTTYGEIARKIGRSHAARAVGQALARNPIPLVIPCHRVLGADGSLHGYSGAGGIKTKRRLLVLEGALPF